MLTLNDHFFIILQEFGRTSWELFKMNRLGFVVLMVVLCCGSAARAQFKSQVEDQASVSDAFVHDSGSSFFFGWFDPNRFQMHHSFSFSYQTVGGLGGMTLGTYTNSMQYDVADNLTARADLSLSYSPYNSFSQFGGKDNLSSLYLSRAEIDYRPWDNVLFQMEYRNVPYGYYSPFYNPWMHGGY